eukprot:SAG11_NODE_4276_length_1971_cov_1.231303_3_plen_203_part_00
MPKKLSETKRVGRSYDNPMLEGPDHRYDYSSSGSSGPRGVGSRDITKSNGMSRSTLQVGAERHAADKKEWQKHNAKLKEQARAKNAADKKKKGARRMHYVNSEEGGVSDMYRSGDHGSANHVMQGRGRLNKDFTVSQDDANHGLSKHVDLSLLAPETKKKNVKKKGGGCCGKKQKNSKNGYKTNPMQELREKKRIARIEAED